VGVQSEINLPKPRKNAINASWSQKGAQMNHGRPKLTIHTMVTWTWRRVTTSSPIMYFVTSGEGYMQVQKFLEFFFYFCDFFQKFPILLRL
jgi:hypothetical protein